MKTVAIYGFGKCSRDMIWQSKADEIWSVNWAWKHNIPRIDRLFDMHPRWYITSHYIDMAEHWEWLQQEHEFPIYMLEQFEEVPNCKLYPIDDVIANVGRSYFTSSVSYMLGLALLDGFDRIEIYGISMQSSTEYAYQKAGTEYLIGIAEGRGIDVYIPEQSALLKSELYGYDGGFQMISRQTLEKMRTEYQNQYDKNMGTFQQKKGAFETLRKLAELESDVSRRNELVKQAQSAHMQFLQAKDNLIASDAALQVATHYIEEVDLEGPDLTIHNNIAVKTL